MSIKVKAYRCVMGDAFILAEDGHYQDFTKAYDPRQKYMGCLGCVNRKRCIADFKPSKFKIVIKRKKVK